MDGLEIRQVGHFLGWEGIPWNNSGGWEESGDLSTGQSPGFFQKGEGSDELAPGFPGGPYD